MDEEPASRQPEMDSPEPARSLVDTVPEDVHTIIVRVLMAQPRRPEALVALTSTCTQLRALLPPEIQREAARDTVDHTLGVRPTPSELHALGIMPCAPHTSARLAEAQVSLRRGLARAALGASLTGRPADAELRRTGILKASPNVSPRLVDTADRLERQLRRNSLKQSVERRPDAAELREAGIVKTPPALSHLLAEVGQRLEHRIKRDCLTHSLVRRCSLDELSSRGILRGGAGMVAEVRIGIYKTKLFGGSPSSF